MNYAQAIIATFALTADADRAVWRRVRSEGHSADVVAYWCDRSDKADALVEALEAYAEAFEANPAGKMQ